MANRRKRCPNGTRRNLKTNKCERKKRRLRSNSKRTRRCPNGSRRIPPKTGFCVRKSRKSSSTRRKRRRCPNGSRRHPPKTGTCVRKSRKSRTRTLTLPSRSSSRKTSSRRRSLKL